MAISVALRKTLKYKPFLQTIKQTTMTLGTTINRYSDSDKQIIMDALAQYPDNRTRAFEQAAQTLGRTPASISAYYYAQQKKKGGGKKQKRKYQKQVGIPEGYELMPIKSNSMAVRTLMDAPIVKRRKASGGGLSAFDIAVIAIESLTQDEMKQLIRVMLNK